MPALPFRQSMVFQSLLLCRDAKLVSALRQALSRLDDDAAVCNDSHAALELMHRQRFEAAIIDLQVFNSHLVMQRIKEQTSHRTLVAAILGEDGNAREAFD